MMIHQIWLGAEMPAEQRADAERLSRACARARVEYKLWGQEELWARYGTEPAVRELDRLRPHLPAARFASLASDYFRWRVLVEAGGLYLDTDTQLTAHELPELPAEGDLWLHGKEGSEWVETGFILARGQRGQQAAERICSAVADKLRGVTAEHAARKWGLLTAAGPRWFTREVLPELRAVGYRVGVVPQGLASTGSSAAAFWHYGRGAWINARGAAMPAPDTRPAWQRPRATVVLPERRRKTEDAEVVPEVLRAHFALPEGTRRVVLLANSVRGFCAEDAGLREGDLVVHFSRARHKERAMELAPSAVHWLICRSGGKRPRNWYTPANFDGFERVLFLDAAAQLHRCAFQRAYSLTNPGKSPTTGFIAAALFRALHPGEELVLAGFDPGVSHGSPMYEGHAWQYEAEYYLRNNFNLIKPHE